VRFVAIGVATGIAMAASVTRLLSTMLFGVAATDAITYGQVAIVVFAASVVACAVPTARVGRFANSVLKAE
jgi:putative ABC transport system permease protein